ncbi:hypothetical protein [Hymenobacter armeniacus]|uniref:Uncharacterized protein n=1 Tax=Hymenobacter armeniacus TaxID=2771358 RepID=A0ABR8JZA0_9BACT|nr:hypothetical protein [Hymenobacter armeniacus]MBD2724550.1 hypothetical protein [Hymenobacter armeniacus]
MLIDFIEPWVAVDSERASFEEEFRCELSPDNVLSGYNVQVIGRRVDCDDVLFEVRDEKANFKLALVHLTWSGKVEAKRWPMTKVFADEEAFIKQMTLDTQDYNL